MDPKIIDISSLVSNNKPPSVYETKQFLRLNETEHTSERIIQLTDIETGAVRFTGFAQGTFAVQDPTGRVMSYPVSLEFPLEATTVKEAFEKHAAGADQAMEEKRQQLENIAREQQQRPKILVPRGNVEGLIKNNPKVN